MPYNYQNTYMKPDANTNPTGTILANQASAINNAKTLYAFKQEKGLNDAWASTFDPATQKLDTSSFISKANALGIGPSAAKAWMDNKVAMSDTTFKTAKNDAALAGMGKDASLDYNAMKGYSVQGAGAPIAPTTIDADNLPDPNAPDYGTKQGTTTAPSTPKGVAVAPTAPTVGKTPSQMMEERTTIQQNADGSMQGSVNIGAGNEEARGGEEAKLTDPGYYVEPDRRDTIDKIRDSSISATQGAVDTSGLWNAENAYANTAKHIGENAAIDFVTSHFNTPKTKKDANGNEVATTKQERAQFAHDAFIKQAIASVATTDNDYNPLPANVVLAKKQEAIQKAESEWNKMLADAKSAEIAGQGAKQNATDFSNRQKDRKKNQELLDDARSRGFAIGPEQLPDFLKKDAAATKVEEARKELHKLIDNPNLDKMKEDEFISKVYNAMVTYQNTENISSVAAAEKAESGLRIGKSLAQSIKEYGMTRELIIDRIKNLGAQDKLIYLKNLSYRVDNAHQAEIDRDEYKAKKTPDKLLPKAGEGTRENPIPYVKGMKTFKGKWYNVGGIVSEGKN